MAEARPLGKQPPQSPRPVRKLRWKFTLIQRRLWPNCPRLHPLVLQPVAEAQAQHQPVLAVAVAALSAVAVAPLAPT